MNSELWPLFAALTIVWLGLGGYVAWLVQRQERLRQEIAALRATLASQQARPATEAERSSSGAVFSSQTSCPAGHHKS